jgi:hypothetical protein
MANKHVVRADLTVTGLNNVIPNMATCTTGVGHYYADGTSGNDANDGLTVGTPKKTLQAVFDLVPYLVKHNTCVHLAGTFTSNTSTINRSTLGTVTLVIDGGTALTTVADSGGSPWTADIHTTATIGLTTAGWAVDAYAGYFVEIVDGACAGQHRLIQGNTADTITPVRSFSTDPGTCSFRVSRPSTTLHNSSILMEQVVQAPFVQNVYCTGTSYLQYLGGDAQITHVVMNSSGTIWAGARLFQSYAPRYNTTTFALELGTSYSNAGLSSVSTGKVSVYRACYSSFIAAVIKTATCSSASVFAALQGSRFGSIALTAAAAMDTSSSITNTAGWANTRLGWSSPSIGISLVDSPLRIGSGVDISGSASHGIECNHSRLHLDGAVTGTGNGGAGVYAHSGSVVHIKNGAPPTLTGTVGDLAVSDPALEESTWAAIDAGTPVAVLAEMTMAKEVA